MKPLNANVALTLGLLVRLALIAVSEYADQKLPKNEPGYTDVDYKVFTRAAQHVAAGGSPYKEKEYRYSPFFALVMLPSVWWKSWAGKVIFCAIDVGVACVLHAIFRARGRSVEASYEKSLTGFLNGAYNFVLSKLGRLRSAAAGKRVLRDRASGNTEPEKINLVWLWWLFNPVVIAVSTRGNADSLVTFLVVFAVLFLVKGRAIAAAVALGLSIHLKLYPVIYVLPALLFVDHNNADKMASESEEAVVAPQSAAEPDASPAPRRRGRPSKRDSTAAAGAAAASPSPARRASTRASPARASPARASPARAAAKKAAASPSPPAGASATTSEPARESAAAASGPLLPVDFAAALDVRFLATQITARRAAFLAALLAAAAAPTLAAYLAYGQEAIDAAYLYHFGRADSHHNFSPFWYYVRAVETGAMKPLPLAGLLAFLPQAFAVVSLGVALHRDLPAAFFYQTFFFVALNKVVTVQYFVWYLALLPLALAGNAERLRWQGAGKVFVWLAFLGLWLLAAYQLEFRRARNHATVFFFSLMFLANNLYIAVDLLGKQKEASIAWPAPRPRRAPAP
eukprot:tig00001284_g8002.t1